MNFPKLKTVLLKDHITSGNSGGLWLQKVNIYSILYLPSMDLAVQCYCTFQSNELWAIEVDHRQQSCAVRHILQQVVQQREVLKCPTRQVISAVTYLHSKRGHKFKVRTLSHILTCHTQTQHLLCKLFSGFNMYTAE